MKAKNRLLTLLLVAGLVGCGRQQPRNIVILPDVSGSIDRQALEQAFKAIDRIAALKDPWLEFPGLRSLAT